MSDFEIEMEQTDENWITRVKRNFDKAFLFQIIIQMINDGLLVMKMLALKELFKTRYGL